MLTQDELKRLLHYDPETGIFTWLVDVAKNVKSGTRAGCVHTKRGGYQSRVITIAGKVHLEHRLAFLYMTGEWPPEQVDHRDMDALNNRWNNLRLATRSQNNGNTKAQKNNKLGLKGVRLKEDCKKYQASIQKDGKQIYLGLFSTPEEAHAAYCAAAIEHFGEFARYA